MVEAYKLIITDFAKAFDVVPHHRLLYKINWYSIRGSTSWMLPHFSGGVDNAFSLKRGLAMRGGLSPF